MYYLYGTRPPVGRKLVATFGSEQQLLSYQRWATLAQHGEQYTFEQKSALAGYQGCLHSAEPLGDDDPEAVVHNPSPSML